MENPAIRSYGDELRAPSPANWLLGSVRRAGESARRSRQKYQRRHRSGPPGAKSSAHQEVEPSLKDWVRSLVMMDMSPSPRIETGRPRSCPGATARRGQGRVAVSALLSRRSAIPKRPAPGNRPPVGRTTARTGPLVGANAPPGNRDPRPRRQCGAFRTSLASRRCTVIRQIPGKCMENPPSFSPCRDWPDCAI